MTVRRVAVTVPSGAAEIARAWMIEAFHEGFEESERGALVELAAYTDRTGEERIRSRFGTVATTDIRVDWRERWREFHRPVRIGPLWIGPPWQPAPSDASAVVIDPGRAFGTGAHATTRLCVELLLRSPAGSILDVGCGSGVLAIAAARLGHRPVIAVDDDRAAVEAASRNAAANDVAVDVRLADALADDLPPADTALANVSLGAVVRIAERVDARRLVTSGYLAADRPIARRFRHLERREREGWAADLFERRQ